MSSSLPPMLTIAIRAARLAGDVINRGALDLNRITVERKQNNDFVSDIDRNAEEVIIQTLREAYPDHAILGEEGGLQGSRDAECRWIIDPLDGTTNYLHGLPHYAVSIAMYEGDFAKYAVIFDPVNNNLFTAARGKGAYLNNRRLRVSRQLTLQDSLIGTGFPYRNFKDLDAYTAIMKDLMQKVSGLRRPGSAALDLAYVAAGYYDAFWEFGLNPWDIAAGVLLIQEAGGRISDLMGEQHFMTTGNIVAGTPKVFEQLLSLIQSHLSPTDDPTAI